MENCSIQELSPERGKAFFQFFDREAFSDNPHWASCYCQFYLTDHSQVDWDARTAEQNREAAKNRIDSGSMHGCLAYLEGKVVGWCHAGPKLAFPALANEASLQTELDGQVGAIVCFIVAPEARRQGIARQLLEFACLGLAEAGMRYAEGYPRLAAVSQAANYHGPLGMYLDAGFEVLREQDGYNVVRKALA
jgi:ribosomal protein S18 acetylase RimI-like enzyme